MLQDALDDYRFAWRWMLPGRPSHVLTGDDGADAFLRESIPAQSGSHSLMVVDADAWVRLGEVLPPAELAEVRSYALFGSPGSVRKLTRKLEKPGANARDYALLPPGSPRVVVPLCSRYATLQGLSLHNPGSRAARWAMWVLRGLASLGVVAPLRQRTLRLISHEPMRPWILNGLDATAFGGNDFALYLGAQGPNRKTVSLATGGSNRPKHIIKTAELPLAKKKLANEALMLRQLANTAVSGHIPALVSFHESESACVLVQAYHAVTPSRLAEQRDAAVRFLDSKYCGRHEWVALDSLIERTKIQLPVDGSERGNILDALRCKTGNLRVPLGLVHGDFAPWNCGISSGKLVVYDWEEGEVDGLPLDDAFSYVVFPLLLVHHISDTRRLAADAVSFAQKTRAGGEIDLRKIQACQVLWSVRRPGHFYPEVFTRMAREITDDL